MDALSGEGMKILLDPVYSTYPSKCSSAAKCAALIERFQNVGQRSDVVFYWLYPKWLEQDELWPSERKWLSQYPNVQLIALPYSKDRMREYMKFTAELDNVYAFNGAWWDFDVVFTSRTSMIPVMRAVMASPRSKKHARHLKTVVNFEEMIMMSFRPTVALADVEAQEALTCLGYMSSDAVLLMTEAEKAQVMQVVRQYMSPAMTRKIGEKIVLASQAMFKTDELKVKDNAFMFRKGERPFVLSFTGRLESASNLDTLYDVMEKQFIWRGMNMKMLVTTVTPVTMHPPPDFVEVRRPNRKQFWKAIKTEMDLVLALHTNVEWSLSIFEPMLLGTPVLLHDQKWSRDILGDEYPFYVKGMADVYAWVREFYLNYEKWYGVFAEYHQKILVPLFTEGGKYGTSMYDIVFDHIIDFEEKQKQYVELNFPGKVEEGKIPHQIAQFVKDRERFVLFDVIKEMDCFDVLESKVKDGDRERRRITFSTDWVELRMLFKYFFGWKDGMKVGEFVR